MSALSLIFIRFFRGGNFAAEIISFSSLSNIFFFLRRDYGFVLFLSNPFPNKSLDVAFRETVKSRLWAKAPDAVQRLVNTAGPHLSTIVGEHTLPNGKVR